jgi:hypothetical protein
MRTLALLALAAFGVLGLTLPCAAQTGSSASELPRTVTVPKQSTPQLLAPAQTETLAPALKLGPVSPPREPEPAAAAPATPPPVTPVATTPVVTAPVVTTPMDLHATMPQTVITPMSQEEAPAESEAFSSPERLMEWITSYRKHRQPWRVPAAVHAMQEIGLFADEEKAWFCTGFIAGVLGSNPKDGPALIAKMFPMPDKEQAVIIRAIVYSGRPDWRELLEKYSSKMPLRRPLIDDFLEDRRPTLMKLPLDNGGSPGIYALWGYYVATGQYQPVVRIMEALRWSRSKDEGGFSWKKVFSGWGGDPSAVEKITTGGTAKWTLASYAERDRELLNLYRAEYERQPQEIAKPLKEVINAAELFESETIRKDQVGAIEDAQKKQLTNEAGMSKGATAGSIAIATGCVAASALGQAYIALPCVIGGALYTGAVKLAR